MMHPGYAKAIGRMAYIWGWPMVNQFNRCAASTQAPQAGRLDGVLPVAPRGQVGMLSDYIDPGQTFVTCPNQDVVLEHLNVRSSSTCASCRRRSSRPAVRPGAER